MKRKTIIITGILILTLLAITGYFLYPYYVKQKTISEKTAEINTIEKDFKNSTDRASRLELLKSTIQESKDYTKSKKFFSEISDQYKTLISSMQNKFVKEYQQIMEENAPLDIGAWSVTEEDNSLGKIHSTIYTFSYDPENDYGGGAMIYVLDMSDTSIPLPTYASMIPSECEEIGVTSFGYYDVFKTEAGAGFFFDGGATITLK